MVIEKILDMIDKVVSRKSRYKQIILVREDLHLPKGKMAAQVAHASVAAVMDTEKEGKKDLIENWKKEGMKKVVLRCPDLKQLNEFKDKAEEKGLVAIKISDAGRTVIKRGTITCLGIGPDEEAKIDEVSGELKVY